MGNLTQTVMSICVGILIGFGLTRFLKYSTNQMAIDYYDKMVYVSCSASDTISAKDITEYKDQFVVKSDSSIIPKSSITWIRFYKELKSK